MIQLECKVFVYTEDQDKLIEAGIDVEDDITKADLQNYTFYNIDVIKPYDHRFCTIHSGCEAFVVNQTYDVIKERIRQQMIFKFN